MRPLKLLEKDRDAKEAFANIAEDDLSDGEIVAEIEKFTSKRYSTKWLASVDEARFEMFLRKYETNLLQKLKNLMQPLHLHAAKYCITRY